MGRILGIVLGVIVGCALIASGAYIPTLPPIIAPDIVGAVTVNQGAPSFLNSQAWGVTLIPSATSQAAVHLPCSSVFGESAHVCKGSAGNLYKWQTTTGWVPGWFVVLDTTTAPTVNATISPTKCVYFPANTSFADSWDPAPVPFANGLTLAFTTAGCYKFVPSPTAFLSADYM